MSSVEIYTDGASRGNPGKAAYGFVFVINKEIVLQKSHFLGNKVTNNVAEYKGIISALETAKSKNYSEVSLFTDSQLAVKQINGEWRVKTPHIIPLVKQVKQLLSSFEKITFTHVRRNHRYISIADKLCNDELDLH